MKLSGAHVSTVCVCARLAAIVGVDGDTGVKPQHRFRHLHTAAPPRPSF